jgi:hypothetical protein
MQSKLANHFALFCSHDNTGYLVKYIDPVLGPVKINSPHFKWWFFRMRCHFKSSNSDWTRFQVLAFLSNCADLKSSPVLIVGRTWNITCYTWEENQYTSMNYLRNRSSCWGYRLLAIKCVHFAGMQIPLGDSSYGRNFDLDTKNEIQHHI